MTSTRIEDLFDVERLPQGFLVLPICLYFPFGLVLALLRFFIGLHTFLVACLLPKTAFVRSFILRTMCFVLGIVVHESSEKHRNRSAKVIVTNHVTTLDHLAVDLVLACTVPSIWDLPKVLSWSLGFKDLGIKQGREILVQNVKKHCEESDLPILAHPEGDTTNGRVGLLKFSTWPFCVGEPISPVILHVRRPYLLNVSTSVLGSRWWSDLFWFLFSPCTIFTIRYLPEMRREAGKSEEDFTREVQKAMASALGVEATNFTCADKVEYLKRVLFHPSLSVTPSQPSDVPLITQMAYQVKEVLPYVPLDAIKQDLARTSNVSLTISNILEGVVDYEPETTTSSHPVSSSAEAPSKELPTRLTDNADKDGASSPLQATLNTAAPSFGKSAAERMSSFQERKARLVAMARQRYIATHSPS